MVDAGITSAAMIMRILGRKRGASQGTEGPRVCAARERERDVTLQDGGGDSDCAAFSSEIVLRAHYLVYYLLYLVAT